MAASWLQSPLDQQSPTFLAPGTSFVKTIFHGRGDGNASNGEWDEASFTHLLLCSPVPNRPRSSICWLPRDGGPLLQIVWNVLLIWVVNPIGKIAAVDVMLPQWDPMACMWATWTLRGMSTGFTLRAPWSVLKAQASVTVLWGESGLVTTWGQLSQECPPSLPHHCPLWITAHQETE